MFTFTDCFKMYSISSCYVSKLVFQPIYMAHYKYISTINIINISLIKPMLSFIMIIENTSWQATTSSLPSGCRFLHWPHHLLPQGQSVTQGHMAQSVSLVMSTNIGQISTLTYKNSTQISISRLKDS